MKLRVDPGLLHGFEPRLHDAPVGNSISVTDTGIGGRIAFGILAQSRVLHDDRTGTGQIAYDFELEWLPSARKYYTTIVGKYGSFTEKLLSKVGGLDIRRICPLHGFIIRI